MKLKGYEVAVDVAAELNNYEWRRPRWAGNKFQACSPFRDEKTPSTGTVFNFGASRSRTLVMDGEPWFVAKDVCEVLEVDNSRQALTGLEEYEKDAVILNDTMGRPQNTAIMR